MKKEITQDHNAHYEQTHQEIEKANADADYIRKDIDIDDPTPAARRYRIKKHNDRIKLIAFAKNMSVVNKDRYSKMKGVNILKELEDKFGGDLDE